MLPVNAEVTSMRNGSYASNTSILSEYLKLVEVASRLETYLSNRSTSQVYSGEVSSNESTDDEDFMNVKEEARLLMSLMSPIPRRNAESSNSEITEKESPRSNANAQNAGFSLRCPSLSLRRNVLTYNGLSSTRVSHTSAVQNRESSNLCPPQLFARPLVTNAWSDIKLVAESMAANTMDSFISALEWRAREWITSLAKCLHFKRKLIQQKFTGPEAERHCRQAMKATKEAIVIESIAKATRSIVVRDIRATFNVLEQQVKQDEDEDEANTYSFSTKPSPPKKRKVCDGWDRHMADSLDLYKVSHSISLDLKITVSVDPQGTIETVGLTAPGAIHGNFTRKDGKVQLNEADINIDTQALAMEIERKSRKMVRKVAETYIVKSNISSPESQDDEICSEYPEEQTTEIVSDENEVSDTSIYRSEVHTRFPSAALITPRQQSVSPVSNSSSDTETMLPPTSRTHNKSDAYFTSEDQHISRRVSPTLDSTCLSSLTSPKLSPPSETSCTNTSFRSNIVIPSLVSPLPNNIMEKSSDIHSLQPRSRKKAPSLPALVEVACAVINAS